MDKATFEYLKERSMKNLAHGNNLHSGWSKQEIEEKIKTGDAEVYEQNGRVTVKVYYYGPDGKRYYAAAC